MRPFCEVIINRLVNYVISEQDAGLDALSNVIARQKAMAIDIGNEVDQQNGLSPFLHMWHKILIG